MGRTFASLQYHNYRVWFVAALVANTGTWMQRISQDWLVIHELTNNDAFAVGVITALQFLPVLFVMPFSGALADRFDKRKMVFLTQACMLLLALGLGVCVLTGIVNLPMVAAFALATGIVAAFDSPPRLTFITELVPPRSLPNAVGLNSMAFNLARLIGPALSGFLIEASGTGWVFIINAFLFLGTLAALLVMRTSEMHPTPHSETKRSTLRGITEGFSYVRRRSDLRVIFAMIGVASCLALNNQLVTAAMSTSVFHRGAGQYGIVGSVLAIGSLSGAIVGARRTRQPRVRSVAGGVLGLGIALTVNSLMPTFPLYTITLIPVGFFMLLMLNAANTGVQMSTAPEMRGRVVALYQTVNQGVTPIGSLTVGWVAQSAGARWGVGIGAIGSFVAVLGAYLWGRSRWDLEVHYRMRKPLHVEIVGPLEHGGIHSARVHGEASDHEKLSEGAGNIDDERRGDGARGEGLRGGAGHHDGARDEGSAPTERPDSGDLPEGRGPADAERDPDKEEDR